jgi:hypothetical protein
MSSFSKVLKAFHKDAQYLPVEYPDVPALILHQNKPTAEDLESFRESFAAYENECAETKKEIDARFELSLERIKLCALLHGAMNLFGNIPLSQMKHFKWCPHEAWMDSNRRSIFKSNSELIESVKKFGTIDWR